MKDELTIDKAVFLLGLNVDTGTHSVSTYCPICRKGKEKKLNINFDKNVFRCAKCGVKGGSLAFWAIHKGINPKDTFLASKDYFLTLQGYSNAEVRRAVCVKREKPIDSLQASIEIRDKTYENLLKILTLSDAHKDLLKKRGLTDSDIEKAEYRSYPRKTKTVAKMLLEKGCTLEGCPGFYESCDGSWDMVPISDGIMIPQRDVDGRIQGIQIRLTDESRGYRYITLSSGENYPKGCKGKAYTHFSKGDKNPEELIVTEGPLKADIIKSLTGESVLALQGVNAQKYLEENLIKLKENGIKRIFTAFDMDLEKNEHVKSALTSLNRKLEKLEFEYQRLVWDSTFKGLDDYLYSNQEKTRAV